MIDKSKLALRVAVAMVSIASASITSAAFAQSPESAPYRHLYNYAPNRQNTADPGGAKPADIPSLTGGGSAGYNACAGHPRC